MIQTPQLQRLKISDLKFDPENPNYMTEGQMNVLRSSFKRYGNLHPITVDQNNVVADGEHRVKVYQENNEEYIEGYKLDLDDNARRMLRQIMNKNRGQHEPEKDYSELISLIASKDNSELLNQMGINRSTLGELAEIIQTNKQTDEMASIIANSGTGPREQDGSVLEHNSNSFLFGNIKQVNTFFDNETYEQVIEKMQVLMKLLNINNHTDLFLTILNHVYDNRLEYQNLIQRQHVTPPPKTKREYTYS